MSSDDDDVMQITQVVPAKKRKQKRKNSLFAHVLEELAQEQLEHILVEVVETEVCVMADSEIFYNLEDPGDDDDIYIELTAAELELLY